MSEHVRFVILCIVGSLLLFELLLFNVILPLLRDYRRKGCPVRTVTARVVLARHRKTAILPWWLRLPLRQWPWWSSDNDNDSDSLEQQFAYWVTFDVGDSRLEFEVHEEEYSEFQPGDYGELIYQSDQVLSFTRERPDEEHTYGEQRRTHANREQTSDNERARKPKRGLVYDEEESSDMPRRRNGKGLFDLKDERKSD